MFVLGARKVQVHWNPDTANLFLNEILVTRNNAFEPGQCYQKEQTTVQLTHFPRPVDNCQI